MQHMCATVAPGPMSVGTPGGAWSTDPACTLAPARITTGAESARTTVLNHTDAPASTVTSPISTAVGAMNASGCTFGDVPSNSKRGIGHIYSTEGLRLLHTRPAKL